MVSGQGFRRDKLLDRRPYLRLGGITKTVQAVHAIVRQTRAPDSIPLPQHKNSTDLCKSHMSRSATGYGEVRTPATPASAAPVSFAVVLSSLSHAFPSTYRLYFEEILRL